MNNEYLARAHEVIKDSKELIVVASRRARMLALGAPRMVNEKCNNFLDLALLEIAEGKLDSKVGTMEDFQKELKEIEEKTRRQKALQNLAEQTQNI